MVYIMENNGVYGLTKGQFSATADEGSHAEDGGASTTCPRSTAACWPSSWAAASWRAPSRATRSSSWRCCKGALAHSGTAFLDVISPCVTFNNHEGSTKSYKYAKEHEEPLHEIGFVPFLRTDHRRIRTGHHAGRGNARRLPDHSQETRAGLRCPDKADALRRIRDANAKGEFLTGLLYVEPDKPDFTDVLNMHDEPLARSFPTASAHRAKLSRRSWNRSGRTQRSVNALWSAAARLARRRFAVGAQAPTLGWSRSIQHGPGKAVPRHRTPKNPNPTSPRPRGPIARGSRGDHGIAPAGSRPAALRSAPGRRPWAGPDRSSTVPEKRCRSTALQEAPCASDRAGNCRNSIRRRSPAPSAAA